MPLWSFQGAREPDVRLAHEKNRRPNPEDMAGLSKLNSVVLVEVDVVLGEPRSRTTEVIERVRRLPKRELRIP